MSRLNVSADRVARVVTELSGPAICALAGLLIVAFRDAGRGAGAAWGGFAAIFIAGIPMAFIAHGAKAGRWSDHHVGRRDQRLVPLLIAIASVGLGAVLLVVAHAPRELIALVLAMTVGLAVVLLVTLWWKVSIHVAVASGLLAVLVVLFGPWALCGVPAIAAIAWSRRRLDAHTWAQVLVGAALGFLVAISVFPALR